MMAVDMLADGAAGARQVMGEGKPRMTRPEYLAFQRKIARKETFDGAAA